MHSRTFLVTGAAGFIGSHLTDALLATGARVIGLDNFDDFYDPAIKRRNLATALGNPRFRLVEGDIRDDRLLDSILAGGDVDTVFHLAARAGVRPSIDDPLLYQSVNYHGTGVLLEAMRRNGVTRLMFASSSSVYGNSETVPFRESEPVDRPISPYAATKRAGELLCYTYHALFGFDVACLRFFTVYGPRQRPEMAITKFTKLLSEGKPVPMYGDGSTARDYTYIDDIIHGLLTIEGSLAGYTILNLGESQTTTLRQLIDQIAAALGVTPTIREFPLQQGDAMLTYADIAAARALGYRPTTPIAQGILRFVEWYQQQVAEPLGMPRIAPAE